MGLARRADLHSGLAPRGSGQYVDGRFSGWLFGGRGISNLPGHFHHSRRRCSIHLVEIFVKACIAPHRNTVPPDPSLKSGVQIRPLGIAILSVFFALGAAVALIAAAALSFSGSFLEPIWRLNPRAHQAFSSMGFAAISLMGTVCFACAAAAMGLWHGRRWGRWLAIGLLSVNMLGDLVNSVLGIEPRAVIGVPVVLVLLLFLFSRRVRIFFP